MLILNVTFLYIATVTYIEIDSDSISIGDDITTYTLIGVFVQSGVNISVSVEAIFNDDYCDPVISDTLIDGGE